MRSSLKLLTALALAATLLAGCKGGKEEDHSLDEFSATVGLGIYKDGNPVLTFLKTRTSTTATLGKASCGSPTTKEPRT